MQDKKNKKMGIKSKASKGLKLQQLHCSHANLDASGKKKK